MNNPKHRRNLFLESLMNKKDKYAIEISIDKIMLLRKKYRPMTNDNVAHTKNISHEDGFDL